MLKSAYKFINKTNPILIFVIAVALIFTFTREIIDDLTREKYQPPKVELVNIEDNDEENNKINYEITFYEKVKDTFIFKVKSNKIMQDEESRDYLYAPSYTETNVVNVLFAKQGVKASPLFEKDIFLVAMQTPSYEEKSQHNSKNIYMAVLNDSNDDGYLSSEDRKSLYISDYDGKNIKEIAVGVIEYRFSGTNEIVIKSEYEGKEIHQVYNLISGILNKVDVNF